MKNPLSNSLPKPDNPPLVQPIFHSVKYSLPSMDELRKLFAGKRDGYYYSRYRNPTVHQLELELATLQSCESAVAMSNGLASLYACLSAFTKPGDEIVYFIESYRPTRLLIEQLLVPRGVKARRISLQDEAAIKSSINDKTSLVIFESPSNPQLQPAPIELIVATAKKHSCLTILDNTLAGFHNHQDYDIDLYLHSLTKFASGHSDAMGGVVLSNKTLSSRLRKHCELIGSTLDPYSASLILRGLSTYQLRYDRACQTAMKLALWLETHPAVEAVFYPGLKKHAGHSRFVEQQKDFGSVLMMNLKNKEFSTDLIFDQAEVFKILPSLGAIESLMVPVLELYGTDLTKAERQQASIDSSSIRIAVGLEDSSLLIQELDALLSLSLSERVF